MNADTWPDLVRVAVRRDGESGELLSTFERHVSHMARPYPDAYFALGRKSPEAFADLTHRAYASCVRIRKGRHPFAGREPFLAFVEEDFDGRTMRYHAIYGRLSIAREILRDDYARNIRRDPVLRWRADLYKDIGAVLRERAEPVSAAKPLRWRLKGAGPSALRSVDVAIGRLRGKPQEPLEDLVIDALGLLGTATRSQIAQVLGAILEAPAPMQIDDPVTPPREAELHLAVRDAVRSGWEALDDDARSLLRAVARGEGYDEVIARDPRLNNKVAVSRAVGRIAAGFVARLEALMGDTEAGGRPRDIVEHVLDVLAEIDPEVTR